MKNSILILFLIFSTSLFAQKRVVGNGKIASETRNVSPQFTGVHTFGSFDVEIKDGKQDGKIQLNGESNIIALIDVNVVNGILTLKFKNNTSLSYKKSVKITLNAQNLESLQLSGSGNITTFGIQKSDNLNLSIKGSGDIKSNVHVRNLETSIQGSGDITLSGKTDKLKAINKGSGDLLAFDLMAKDVEISKAGSGNTKVNCTGNLNINSAGSGDVHYLGNPTLINSNIRGSGNVKKVN